MFMRSVIFEASTQRLKLFMESVIFMGGEGGGYNSRCLRFCKWACACMCARVHAYVQHAIKHHENTQKPNGASAFEMFPNSISQYR